MEASQASMINTALSVQNNLLVQLADILQARNLDNMTLTDKIIQFFDQMKKQTEQIYQWIAENHYQEEVMLQSAKQSQIIQPSNQTQPVIDDQDELIISVKQRVYSDQQPYETTRTAQLISRQDEDSNDDQCFGLGESQDTYQVLKQTFGPSEKQNQIGLILAVGTSMYNCQLDENQITRSVLNKETDLSISQILEQTKQQLQFHNYSTDYNKQLNDICHTLLESEGIEKYLQIDDNSFPLVLATLISNKYSRRNRNSQLLKKKSSTSQEHQRKHSSNTFQFIAKLKALRSLIFKNYSDSHIWSNKSLKQQKIKHLGVYKQMYKLLRLNFDLDKIKDTYYSFTIQCYVNVLFALRDFYSLISSDDNLNNESSSQIVKRKIIKEISGNFVVFLQHVSAGLKAKSEKQLTQRSLPAVSRVTASFVNKSMFASNLSLSTSQLEQQINVHAEVLAQKSMVEQNDLCQNQTLSQTIQAYKIALSIIIGQIPISQPTELQTALQLYAGFPVIYFMWRIRPTRLSAVSIHKLLDALCSRPLVLLRTNPKFSTLYVRANTNIKKVKKQQCIDSNELVYDEVTSEGNQEGDKLNVFSFTELNETPEKVVESLRLLKDNLAIDLIYSNCEQSNTQKQIGLGIQELPLRSLFYFAGEAHPVNLTNTMRLITLSCVNIQSANLKDCTCLRSLFLRKAKLQLSDLISLKKLEKVCIFECEYDQPDANQSYLETLKEILEGNERLQYFQIEDEIFSGEARINICSADLTALILNFQTVNHNKVTLIEPVGVKYVIIHNCDVERLISNTEGAAQRSMERSQTINDVYIINQAQNEGNQQPNEQVNVLKNMGKAFE